MLKTVHKRPLPSRSSAGGVAGGSALFGFIEMLVFLAILVVALLYVWRKKAIGWE